VSEKKRTLLRIVLWLTAGAVTTVLTVLAFFPAAWLAALLEQQTGGRLTLGDAQGSLWSGSAFVGGAPGKSDPVTPLLPGRFAWHLSPRIVFGQLDLELENNAALSQPVRITGGWQQWQVGPAALTLPADRLAGLGSPLNTVQPSGQMALRWNLLQITRTGEKFAVIGSMQLDLNDVASRLSPIKPLGAYQLTLDWHGTQAQLTLKTVKGPMLLSGSGSLNDGHFQFSGKAEAEAGQEDRLANLLNLLGQRRKEGGRNVIGLEFR
jgi:general secretion pathway protein N